MALVEALLSIITFFCQVSLPCKALREESQATENLLALVKLLHVRRCNHGDTMVVHGTKVVHSQAITHCNVHIEKALLTNSGTF